MNTATLPRFPKTLRTDCPRCGEEPPTITATGGGCWARWTCHQCGFRWVQCETFCCERHDR